MKEKNGYIAKNLRTNEIVTVHSPLIYSIGEIVPLKFNNDDLIDELEILKILN
ncbi:MAG: hypothetical protein RR681_07805 [Lachnospiraceae bacterium]